MRGPNTQRTSRARSLRKADTDAERALWSALQNRQLEGAKFTRQFSIGPYFADFACREESLVIEVDGSQHGGSAYDRNRDDTMNLNGWSVLRFWHIDVLQQRRAVCETIVAVLDGRLNTKAIAADLKYLPAIACPDDQALRRPSSALRAPSPRKRGEGKA